MTKNLLNTLLFGILSLDACQPIKTNINVEPLLLHETMQKMTDIMEHDIFSPSVASRVYVYPSIAAYEVMVQTDSSYASLDGQLKGH